MIISFIENIDESFATLLANLEILKSQLTSTGWDSSYIEMSENQLDEAIGIIQEQRQNIEELTDDIIKNDILTLEGNQSDDYDVDDEYLLDDDEE